MKKGFRILKFKKDKPIFEVKDVSKSFDGRPILKKLSLKVFYSSSYAQTSQLKRFCQIADQTEDYSHLVLLLLDC